MTQAEYARHRGVKPPHINRLVKAGKIPIGGDGRINPADADFALAKDRARVDEPREQAAPAETGGLTRARTATEVYRARMAQLQYEERLGKVLPIGQVEEACAAFGEAIVRIMHALPMFAEELAGAAVKDGVAGARIALRGIERTLLTRIGAACEGLAKQATTAPASAGDDGEIDDDLENEEAA